MYHLFFPLDFHLVGACSVVIVPHWAFCFSLFVLLLSLFILIFYILFIIFLTLWEFNKCSTVLLPRTIGLVVNLSFCMKLINISLHFFRLNFILCSMENLWISLEDTFSKLIPFLAKISNAVVSSTNLILKCQSR